MQRSPVARQVLSESAPTVNVSESEAHASEDNLAASTDEERQEERVSTPPIQEEAVHGLNVSVSDPPAPQVEAENVEATTTNVNTASDVVMDDANVEPTLTVPEANVATEPEVHEDAAPEANEDAAPETNVTTAPEAPVVQPASDVASAPVPPPRPHTIEQAYSHGQLTTV